MTEGVSLLLKTRFVIPLKADASILPHSPSTWVIESVLDPGRFRQANAFLSVDGKKKELRMRRNHGRLEVVTYVRTDVYSAPRDSICQRGCVVLSRGPDSISMYARPSKTQLDRTPASARSSDYRESSESTSLVALFPTLPSFALRFPLAFFSLSGPGLSLIDSPCRRRNNLRYLAIWTGIICAVRL